MRLETELTALFGSETMQQAGQIATAINSGQAKKVEMLASALR